MTLKRTIHGYLVEANGRGPCLHCLHCLHYSHYLHYSTLFTLFDLFDLFAMFGLFGSVVDVRGMFDNSNNTSRPRVRTADYNGCPYTD